MSQHTRKRSGTGGSFIEFKNIDFDNKSMETEIESNDNKEEEFDNCMEYFDTFDYWEEQNSPVEVVRATVSVVDLPGLPQLTFRFWVLSTFYIVLVSVLNGYFFFRESSSYYFGLPLVQFTSYALGNLMAWGLPQKTIRVGPLQFSLNPGPFNIKEHALIGVAGGLASDYPEAIDVLMTMSVYFGKDFGTVFAILLLLTTQLLGYGVAGVLSGILVDPAVMIWPQDLITVTFYNTLHETRLKFSRNLSRLNLFFLVFGIVAIYQFFPSVIMPVLASMPFLCWINPESTILQSLGSGYDGMGILDFSFDWSSLTSRVQPLWTPFWAQANFYTGFIAVFWVAVPIIYSSNLWPSKLIPIASGLLYTSASEPFNPNTVYDLTTGTINHTAIQANEPFLLSSSFALYFGISFLGTAAAISHFWLYHWRDVLVQVYGNAKEDVHTKMMKAYKRVPYLWFTMIFVVMLVFSIATSILYLDLELPWWGVLLSVAIMLVMILPIGVIQALSGFQIGINVITEIVAGYLFPHRPFANMVFKVLGYNSMYQGLAYLKYAKLGHYLKFAPRNLFIVQLYSTSLTALITWAMAKSILEQNMDDIMNVAQGVKMTTAKNPWTVDSIKLFFTSDVIHGIIGPQEFFGNASIYHPLLWCFLLGLLLPVPFYILHRRYRRHSRILSLINIPIMALGAITIPETTVEWVTVSMIVGFVMQYYIYQYQHMWWKKYNYVLAASLDAATQMTGLFVFCVITSTNSAFPEWWGNPYKNPEYCGK